MVGDEVGAGVAGVGAVTGGATGAGVGAGVGQDKVPHSNFVKSDWH